MFKFLNKTSNEATLGDSLKFMGVILFVIYLPLFVVFWIIDNIDAISKWFSKKEEKEVNEETEDVYVKF